MTMVRSRRSDGLPEYHDYIDVGCSYHPRCLTCPFERCRYDVPYLRPRVDTAKQRAQRIRELRASGWVTEQIAAELDLSKRSVFRLAAKYGR